MTTNHAIDLTGLKTGSLIEFTAPEVNGEWLTLQGPVLGVLNDSDVMVRCDIDHKLIIEKRDITKIINP